MQFPQYSNYFRCHMPFCNQCNNTIVYMMCIAKQNGLWKIYYNTNGQWIRLTNSQDDIIECNPNIYYYNNKYYISYIAYNGNKYLLKCLTGDSMNNLQLFKEIVTFTGFELKNKIYKTNRTNGFEIVSENNTELVTLEKCNKILRLTYNPQDQNQIIITYMYNNKNYVCSIKDNQIKQITSKQPMYKTFKYGSQCWNVFKFNNSDNQELRIVKKVQYNLIDIDNKIIRQVKK